MKLSKVTTKVSYRICFIHGSLSKKLPKNHHTTFNVRHALLSYFDETSSGISLAGGEKIKSEYFFLQSKTNGNLRTTDFDLDLEINNKAPHQLLFIMRMIHQP